MSFLQKSVCRGILRPFRKIGLAAAARWPWPVGCNIATGRKMYVDLRSAVGRGIYMQGQFDPAVFTPFERFLQSGHTFLDIGANVGYYSIRALDRIGCNGQIHAFEIDDRPLRCLRRTILTQGLTNLHLHEIAVGDRTGTIRLVRKPDCGQSHITDEVTRGHDVPMTTLDEWHLENGKPLIHAIKMDIEGAELRALRGATRVLAECKPFIVCEALDGSSPTESAAARFLRALGYSTDPLRDVHSPAIVAIPK